MADNHTFFHQTVFVNHRFACLTHHFCKRRFCRFGVILCPRICFCERGIHIFKIGQINIDQPVKRLQGFHALISAAVIDNRHGKPLLFCQKKCLPDLQRVVARRHEVDVVCILRLQLQKNVRKPVNRDHFSALHLRDMMVLAVDAPQIASGKENRPRPRRPGNTRFFPEMQRRPRRCNPGGRLTIPRLPMLPVRPAVPRTDPAAAHLLFQIQHMTLPFPVFFPRKHTMFH